MAEYINKTDSLNDGREKLNKSIQDSVDAKIAAESADEKSTQALSNSENTQDQLDQVVVEGDSSVEAAQARVKEDGTTFDTLRDRLNSSDSQLAQKQNQIEDTIKLGNVTMRFNSSKNSLDFVWG